MTRHELINPTSLGAPIGYSNGVLAKQGRLLFVAGQIGWDGSKVVSDLLSEQFDRLGDKVTVGAFADRVEMDRLKAEAAEKGK